MSKGTCRRKNFMLKVSEGESMSVISGDLTTSRKHGVRAVTEILHPYPKIEGRELAETRIGF